MGGLMLRASAGNISSSSIPTSEETMDMSLLNEQYIKGDKEIFFMFRIFIFVMNSIVLFLQITRFSQVVQADVSCVLQFI